jgi:hypothetical protein
MGEIRSICNILAGKPEVKRLLGRFRHRWEDNDVDLGEIGWEVVDWMHLDYDRNLWWDLHSRSTSKISFWGVF